VLDELDWELERRGHRFARYADDCNIVVGSERSGRRVMASVTRFIEESLRLTVNTRKSAVDRPWNRKFLGFTVTCKGIRLKVAEQAIDKLKDRVRELTRCTRGHRLEDVVAELRVCPQLICPPADTALNLVVESPSCFGGLPWYVPSMIAGVRHVCRIRIRRLGGCITS